MDKLYIGQFDSIKLYFGMDIYYCKSIQEAINRYFEFYQMDYRFITAYKFLSQFNVLQDFETKIVKENVQKYFLNKKSAEDFIMKQIQNIFKVKDIKLIINSIDKDEIVRQAFMILLYDSFINVYKDLENFSKSVI